jgi:translation initiation factor IF-2
MCRRRALTLMDQDYSSMPQDQPHQPHQRMDGLTDAKRRSQKSNFKKSSPPQSKQIKKWSHEYNVLINEPSTMINLPTSIKTLPFTVSCKIPKDNDKFHSLKPTDSSGNIKKVISLLQDFEGVSETVVVPRRSVGRVVGKAFVNVNRLEKECGVDIEMQQSDLVDNGLMTIWGESENVQDAKKKLKRMIGIRMKITVPRSVSRNFLSDCHEQWLLVKQFNEDFGVSITSITDTEFHLRGPDQKSLNSAVNRIENEMVPIQKQISINPKIAGRVIGKNAVNLKSIVKTHTVSIHQPGRAKNEMVIRGTKPRVEAAMLDIEKLIGREKIVHVPKQYLPAIIAKDFARVKKLQQKHDVLIARHKDAETQFSVGSSFKIWGPNQESVDNAEAGIKAMVDHELNKFHETVEVHESLFGLFIGTNGDNIKSLERIYDVKVSSPKDIGDVERQRKLLREQLQHYENITDKNESQKAFENELKERYSRMASKQYEGKNTKHFELRGEDRDLLNQALDAVKKLARAPWCYSKFKDVRPSIELDIPTSHHGRVVGRNGDMVMQVRDEFSVDVKLPPMSVNATTSCIRGKTMEGCLGAMEAIQHYAKLTFDLNKNGVYVATPIVTFYGYGTGKGKRKFHRGPNIDAEILQKIEGKNIPIKGNETLTDISKVTGAHIPMLMKICRAEKLEVATPLTPLSSDALEMLVLGLGAEPVLNDSAGNIVVRSKRLIDEAEEDDVKHRRAPIVAIMGHVDHGKTTLLDSLRSNVSNIADVEVGGITQSTTAFSVHASSSSSSTSDDRVTFVDTPGHAAFSTMRESGINSTDILVLVVAADDGVMEQTIESATAAKDNGIPIVVAITKCDINGIDAEKATANIEQDLSDNGIICENLGGDVQVCCVSGLTGEGQDNLIETLALQSEMMGLKANKKAPAEAVVLEGSFTKGVGPVADVVVQWGTLKTRDFVVVGETYGRVKSLVDCSGKRVKVAPPSTPVRVMGLNEVPKSGSDLIVVNSLEEAREAAEAYKMRAEWSTMVLKSNEADELEKQAKIATGGNGSVAAAEAMMAVELNEGEEEPEVFFCDVIVSTSSDGGLAAVQTCLDNITNDTGVTFSVLRSIVGEMSPSDVEEAAASGAMVLAFNTKITGQIKKAAQNHHVQIESYDLIYKLEDKLRDTAYDILPTIYEEERNGKAEALQIFSLNGKNAGTAIGLRMKQGKFHRNNQFRLLRNGETVAEGLKVQSLRILKEDVLEVPAGSDCGILLVDGGGYGVVAEVGDEVEAYENVEQIRKTGRK